MEDRAHCPEIEEPSAGRLAGLVYQAPSWLVSMLVHTIVLLVLALLTLPPEVVPAMVSLVARDPGPLEELTDVRITPPLPPLPPVEVFAATSAPPQERPDDDPPPPAPPSDLPPVELGIGLEATALPSGDVLGRPHGTGKHRIGDRIDGYTKTTGKPEGQAVAAALKWLAEHQLPDGSWSFAHHHGPSCRGQCRNPGDLEQANVAATALALLPFLGAGQTHKQGQYRKQVHAGLYFLVQQMQLRSGQGGSLYEPGGRMYSHGLASIALCEAYAMTRDKGIFAPAQQSITFIAYAQDPIGGGWRYEPRQPGDTSVVGWQIMALKSGYLAYLQVPPETTRKAFHYLDSVQADSGAAYGYTSPGNGMATTAIGLLCRMHLGWKKDNPALERGVQWISAKGPSTTNMYYNYYAAQIMRHWEGEPWRKWDQAMKKHLLSTQATHGHEAGSWYFSGGDHGSQKGGRLYCTAMAAMTLEVEYRTMGIYGAEGIETDFPLD